MTPEDQAALEALRERVEALENLMAHQAGLSIVLYNGLLRSSSLMLDITRVTSPAPINPLHGETPHERAALAARVREGLDEMRAILDDLFTRLEPMRGYLTDKA